MREVAFFGALFGLLVVGSLIAFRQVRWYRKPHQGHWKKWDE